MQAGANSINPNTVCRAASQRAPRQGGLHAEICCSPHFIQSFADFTRSPQADERSGTRRGLLAHRHANGSALFARTGADRRAPNHFARAG